MSSRKTSLREIASLCDVPGPEDGVDPRSIARGSSRKKKVAIRKDRQLCREAEVTLRLALSELRDEASDGLAVVRVEPAPDAGHLRVCVAVAPGTGVDRSAERPEDLEALLERVEGGLRAAVASAIHRKRAPRLSFVLVPGEFERAAAGEEGERE